MDLWQHVFLHKHFRYLDHTNLNTLHHLSNDALLSFAVDDCLALAIGNEADRGIMRMWTHDQTIVLGIADSRLPHIKEGVAYLREQGFNVIIRNSGGLAVPLDQNVLNISLILPNMRNLSIDDGYVAMKGFISKLFQPFTQQIEAYEIVGSYCPGDYDLSIGGRKFAGISQRRVRDGVAVQIYLDVLGDSKRRAEIIRDFYQISTQNSPVKSAPPSIVPEKMASLSELLGKRFEVADVKTRAIQLLRALTSNVVEDFNLQASELAFLETRYAQMLKRNEDMME